jgi:hypothetical protein
MMLAAGQLEGFAACCAPVRVDEDGSAAIGRGTADMLGLAPGDAFLAMSR